MVRKNFHITTVKSIADLSHIYQTNSLLIKDDGDLDPKILVDLDKNDKHYDLKDH